MIDKDHDDVVNEAHVAHKNHDDGICV